MTSLNRNSKSFTKMTSGIYFISNYYTLNHTRIMLLQYIFYRTQVIYACIHIYRVTTCELQNITMGVSVTAI